MARKLRVLRAGDLNGTLDMRDVLTLIERAFAERGMGRTEMPPKSYLHFPSHQGVLLIMPGNLPEMDEAAVKLISVHTRNPVEHGLPTLIATIVLISPDTGEPVCIMDGAYVTGMRTGAVSGVATKFLARNDARVLGIVGAGFQGPFQLVARVDADRDAITRNPGDLQGEADGSFEPGASGIEIVIDEVL